MSTRQSGPIEPSAPAPAPRQLVTRYATRSPEAADENQRRIEAVFAELASTAPGNVSYLVLRLADDSFVHISGYGGAAGETSPISSTRAFAHFADGQAERRQGDADQQAATLVGCYPARPTR